MRKKVFRRLRRKMKNFLLKSITFTAGLAWLLAGCCLDSENYGFFIIILAISTAWLYLFSYANGYTY